jgi:hypothetical protein
MSLQIYLIRQVSLHSIDETQFLYNFFVIKYKHISVYKNYLPNPNLCNII